VTKSSDDQTERLPRPIAQALERQNRRLERIETKVDRILELVQMIQSSHDDDLDEFVEFGDELDDELDGSLDIDEITKELEKLSPEEFKRRFVELLATLEASAKDVEDMDEEEEEEP
jgi:hypothetical protein